MTIKLNKGYLLLTTVFFITEFLIALYLNSGFIRYTFGDFLVVILMYCFFKSFIPENHLNIALSVLLFSFFIEFMQLINILDILNLQNNYLLRVIIGSTFQISDLVAYTLGIIVVLIFEYKPNDYA